MRYRWIAVLGVAALVGCGEPSYTSAPAVNVSATQVRSTEVAQMAAFQATANAPTATPTLPRAVKAPETPTPTTAPPPLTATATNIPPTATAAATATNIPPTATTIPTKVPTATPIPTVAPLKVDVLGYELIAPSYGYGKILGMVRNTGSKPASYKVSAGLLDANGKTVGAHESYTEAGVLAPGEQGPFGIIYNSTETPAFTNVKFTVQASGTTGFSLRGNAKPVVGEKNATTAKNGTLRVAGQVQNGGTVGMDLTEIIYAGFSSTGKLLAVDSTFTRPTAVPVGGSAPFEFSFSDPRIVDYAIWLDAWESK